MILKEIKGNLFSEIDKNGVYCHCIANDDNYGAGIAPVFVKFFKQKSKLTEQLKIHTWDLTKTGWCCIINGEPICCHLITKKHTYGKPNYNTVRNALIDMKEKIKDLKVENIYMPKIACGLDKLSWPLVKNIINEVFKDTIYNITVFYL